MAASLATLTIQDGNAASKTIRALDVSGNGSGPFIPAHMLMDAAGAVVNSGNPLPTSSPNSDPSAAVTQLVYSDTSDSVNLAATPRALRIYNGSTSAVTLMCQVGGVNADVPITVPSGAYSYEPIKVTRIKRTGSTGLITAGAITTGIEVLLIS